MVSARAVLLNAPSKLGEQQHNYFLIGVMLLQVLVEVAYGVGDVSPQPRERNILVGVGIKGARVDAGVKHPSSKVGQMNLGNVFQPLGKWTTAVLHTGGVSI